MPQHVGIADLTASTASDAVPHDDSGTTSSPAERGFRYAQLAYLRQPRLSLN